MSLPEDHMGDPNVPKDEIEPLSFNVKTAETPLGIKSKGKYKEGEKFSKLMVEISVAYAERGVSRKYKEPGKEEGYVVDNFLKLFGLNLKYLDGKYVPFCAAGLSFAACEAYCQLNPEVSYDPDDWTTMKSILTDINNYYFKPSPAVRYIQQNAEGKGKWVKPAGVIPKEGWPVVFSWNKDGKPNHIGLVRAVNGKTLDGKNLHTVEYNTSDASKSNGGTVAVKDRDIEFVLGYVDTYKKPAP